VIRDRPPPERSEIVPCLLIATFLVNLFPNLIAVQNFRSSKKLFSTIQESCDDTKKYFYDIAESFERTKIFFEAPQKIGMA